MAGSDRLAEAARDEIVVHAELGTNVAMTARVETGDVEAAFAAADDRLTIHARHPRIAALPIEPRGGIAAYDQDADSYSVWISTQAAWGERTDLAQALGIDEARIRLITPMSAAPSEPK